MPHIAFQDDLYWGGRQTFWVRLRRVALRPAVLFMFPRLAARERRAAARRAGRANGGRSLCLDALSPVVAQWCQALLDGRRRRQSRARRRTTRAEKGQEIGGLERLVFRYDWATAWARTHTNRWVATASSRLYPSVCANVQASRAYFVAGRHGRPRRHNAEELFICRRTAPAVRRRQRAARGMRSIPLLSLYLPRNALWSTYYRTGGCGQHLIRHAALGELWRGSRVKVTVKRCDAILYTHAPSVPILNGREERHYFCRIM